MARDFFFVQQVCAKAHQWKISDLDPTLLLELLMLLFLVCFLGVFHTVLFGFFLITIIIPYQCVCSCGSLNLTSLNCFSLRSFR